MTAALQIRDLAKTYGKAVAVSCFDAEVEAGEFIVLLGPSGCGKTTTLRMIAGFVQPSRGAILLGGNDITHVPPYRRNMAMVFQAYALFPNMSVRQNVAFGLQMRKVPAAEREKRVARALELVRMAEYAERYPAQLSGGQQQRVALARAVVIEPALLLLDEPLSNLDAKLRGEVRGEIRQLQRRLGLTTLMVTHDQDEALSMADRVIVMKQGEICQTGTPAEIYEQPESAYIASFIGNYNVIAGKIETKDRFHSDAGIVIACLSGARSDGSRAALAVRPGLVRIGLAPEGAVTLSGRVEEVNYFGAQRETVVNAGGQIIRSLRPAEEAPPLAHGEETALWWRQADALVVDP